MAQYNNPYIYEMYELERSIKEHIGNYCITQVKEYLQLLEKSQKNIERFDRDEALLPIKIKDLDTSYHPLNKIVFARDDFQDYKTWFSAIADCLMNNIRFISGHEIYTAKECTFHFNPLQKKEEDKTWLNKNTNTGMLYLQVEHGLMLSFKAPTQQTAIQGAYGSISIDVIENLKDGNIINHPLKIVATLLDKGYSGNIELPYLVEQIFPHPEQKEVSMVEGKNNQITFRV